MSTLTIELTPEELKEIIANHVSGLMHDHVKPSEVNFTITQEWSGYGAGEHQTSVFKGAKITINTLTR